jgi:plasmid stabilization system protein ParE
MRLPFHPDALIELDQAVAWHERERAGHGSVLFDEVIRKVEQAARFPRSGAPVLGFDAQYDVRKLVVNRFRYVLITAIVESALMVIAVAHTSRAPGYWRDRLL